MRIRSPSLNELHAFAVTARLRSFSLAARDLCVTQGAVSRAVARLEARVGRPLLLRHGRHCEPTDAGRVYLELIAPALEALDSAADKVRAPLSAGGLRLSVIPTLASKWLIPRLPAFRGAHPDIALSFVPYRRDDPLEDDTIDAWIRVGKPLLPGSMASDYLIGRELVPICHPRELAGPAPISEPADLLRRPLLFHTNYRDNWRLWLDTVGCRYGELKACAEFDQVGMLVQAVIAGLGVAVVQRCLIDDELAAGRVAIAFDRPVSTDRGYFLCYPARNAGPDGPLRSFRAWLLEHAAL